MIGRLAARVIIIRRSTEKLTIDRVVAALFIIASLSGWLLFGVASCSCAGITIRVLVEIVCVRVCDSHVNNHGMTLAWDK